MTILHKLRFRVSIILGILNLKYNINKHFKQIYFVGILHCHVAFPKTFTIDVAIIPTYACHLQLNYVLHHPPPLYTQVRWRS